MISQVEDHRVHPRRRRRHRGPDDRQLRRADRVHQERRQLLARISGRADRLQAQLPQGQLAGAHVVHHRLRRQGLRPRLAEDQGHAAAASRSTTRAATRAPTSSSTARSGSTAPPARRTLFNKDSGNFVQIREGQAFGTGTPLAETVIDVAPEGRPGDQPARAPHRRRTRCSTTTSATRPSSNPFETGWRKESTITLTGSSARVRVVFQMTPI